MPAPAPDLETLFDVEGALDPAFSEVLTDLGLPEVDGQRGQTVVTGRRVESQLTLGAATGHVHAPANLSDGPIDSRFCIEDAWNFTLVLSVITNRDKHASVHAPYRAAIRAFLARWATAFPRERLPFHAISMLRSAGCTVGLMGEQHEDVSQLRYSGVVSIRADAWPEGT